MFPHIVEKCVCEKRYTYLHQVTEVCLVEVEVRSGSAEPTPGITFTDSKEYCPVPHSAHHAPSLRAKRNSGSTDVYVCMHNGSISVVFCLSTIQESTSSAALCLNVDLNPTDM